MRNERRAGALLSYIYIAVNSLIALVFLPILKSRLGSSEYGLYDLAVQIINIMTVMDLGFGNGIVVYTAKYGATGNKNDNTNLAVLSQSAPADLCRGCFSPGQRV